MTSTNRAEYADGTIRVESTPRGWAVYRYSPDHTTRTRIATYTAMYRALEHARRLAGIDLDELTEGL